MMGLMQTAHELDRLDVAEEYIRGYLDLYPANLRMLFVLAGIYFKRDKYAEARELLERILIFEPENQDALNLIDQIDRK